MNKYIVVVTENIHEVVYADDVQLLEDSTLLFYRYEDEDGNTTTLRVAAFKVYEYFLLDEEGVVKPDPEEVVRQARERGYTLDPNLDIYEPVNVNPEPWSIPLKDPNPLDAGYPYAMAVDHTNHSEPIKLEFSDDSTGYIFRHSPQLVEVTADRSPLTWLYFDKDGNLERAEIR